MLYVGLLAMLLHLLADTGLVRAGMAGAGGFVPDVCSNDVMAKAGAVRIPPDDAPQGSHHCCTLGAATGAPMLPATAIAVVSAPTFRAGAQTPASAAPKSTLAAGHRPRGPPAAA